VFFHAAFPPADLEISPSFGGTSADELVVLGQRATDNAMAAEVFDASSRVLLNRIYFFEAPPATCTYWPLDLEIVSTFGDTSAPEIAVLGNRPSDNSTIAQMRDASTDTLVGSVTFDASYDGVEMEVVDNLGGTSAPELVVLSKHESTGAVIGEIRDTSSGEWLKTVFFSSGYHPKGIEVLPNFGGTTAQELAYHGVRPSDGAVLGQVRDASSGALLKNTFFNANFETP
jgi:hypothetical protein